MTIATAKRLAGGVTAARAPDVLTLVVDGEEIIGWQEIDVTLRAEGFPNGFSVTASAKDHIQVKARAGADCRVYLGGDLVISGFVDRDIQSGSPDRHSLQIIGRGRTQDLVDCSGEWPDGQLIGGDALRIARTLALPYKLDVALANGATAGPQVPQWLLNYGETGAEIIQRVARNAGLLAYEDAQGRLLLATVGTRTAASGVAYGENVQAWAIENGMDQRMSEIVCSDQATDALMELGGNSFYDRAIDPNVPRHRLLYAIIEGVGADDPKSFTSTKARWELARRAGRSAVVHATVDNWRDSSGALWEPNTRVPVDLPGNRAGSPLILSEVTFRRSNEAGTTADLLLMPAAAFVPEPIALQPVNTFGLIGDDDA